ncbi:sensor histidine kinase [Desulfotomaculum sp. 1211_IL3151]|uniref:sensor histidine kinase n=1 Tax=Desulfotomaculum sp. 1211_IL3151 TaxID=3084055 RepID=UPI002FD91222
MKFWRKMSLKIKIFIFTLIGGVITLLVAVSIFYLSLHKTVEEQIAAQAMDIAQLAAANFQAREAYLEREYYKLQPIADIYRSTTKASSIVYLNMNGLRLSHSDPRLLGKHITGNDEAEVLAGKVYTSQAEGVSGPSIRAFVPVYDFNDHQIGAVGVAFYQPDIQTTMEKVFSIFYIVIPIVFLLMVILSYALSESIKRSMFGLEPRVIASLLMERETMLQSVKEGIIAIDRNEKVTVINHEAKRLLNIDTEVSGNSIYELIPDSRLPLIMKNRTAEYDQAMMFDKTVVLTNRIPLIFKNKVIGAIATFRDLTELNQLAEELTGVKKIVNTLRAKTHEFMNNMHVVSGLIQLEFYEEAQRYILNLTNQEQSKISFILNSIHNPAAAGILLGKTSEAHEMNIDMVVNEGSVLHFLPQHFGENSFAVVLGNLIENAFQAVANLSVNRRCAEVLIFQDKESITIRVEDAGLGIDKSIADRIFEQGFTTKETGNGFGLNNVYHRVNLAQGTVDFQSSEKGTIFTVVIPNVVN